ncbi:MAG: Rpn family recombination-promoting nuclease/putative transposase [Lachnospiraceae bacterium]|nr:Rpn family recombination-promoting nuclease/putative transposase [Lachnospiraceae bacterium]
MEKRKTLQELTLKDNFLFAAVMMEQENCKRLLELALGVEIEHVEVNTEKSIVYHPEYKGIRLDVFVRDEKNTRFNVEMQVAKQSLEKRTRYYHSQMDMEMLLTGVPYEELPNCYVLFICDFDPFMLKKYRYTVKHVFVEDETFTYQDGSHTVFLSTKGENGSEVPQSLVQFLKYVAVGLNESTAGFGDEFVKSLQTSIERIKSSREMGERYMLFEEMMRGERAAGKAEGVTVGMAQAVLEILEGCGEIPEDLRSRIMSEKDGNTLKQLLKYAVQATTISEFDSMMNLM